MDSVLCRNTSLENSNIQLEKNGKPCLVETLLNVSCEDNIGFPQNISSQLTTQHLFLNYRNILIVVAGDDFSEIIKTLTFSGNIKCFLFVESTSLLYVNIEDELFIINISSSQEFKVKFSRIYNLSHIFANSSGVICFADNQGQILEFSNQIVELLENSSSDLNEIEIELFKKCDYPAPGKPRSQFFQMPLNICRVLNNKFVLKCTHSGQTTEVKINGTLLDVLLFKDEFNILILKELEHSLEHVVVLMQYPSMDVLCEISVLNNCHLIGGYGNTAYFVEVENTNLRLCCVQQMTPFQNLQSLIDSGSYSEAEVLALKHGFFLEDVYKLKIKHLFTRVNENDDVKSEEFLHVFMKMSSVEFIFDSTIEAFQFSFEFIHLLTHLISLELNDASLLKVDELKAKYDIYNLIPSIYRDKVTYFNWRYFVKCSFVDIYKHFIASYKFDLACCAFLRSSIFIKDLLCVDFISDLLYSLPTDAKLQDLFLWIGNLIPFIINCNPYFTDIIAKWSVERIYMLEHNKHWPKVGITFADKIISFIKSDHMPFFPPSLHRLFFFRSSLNHVQILKSKYNVKNISFKDFITNDSYSVVKAILHRTFTEDLKKVLEEFLQKFMREYGVSQDQLIKDHIDEQLCDNIDERRLEILLTFIYDAGVKANCILEILRAAPIPWSKTIENLASVAIQICPSLEKQIKIEILYTQIKCVLLKYDIPDLEADIELVIMRILSKELPEMLNDIDKIVSVYKDWKAFAYLMTICKHIENNKLCTATTVYNKMNEKEQRNCKISLVLQLEDCLVSPDDRSQSYMYYYLDFLSRINVCTSKISIFEKCINVKLCHGITIMPSDYYLDENRNIIFTRWAEQKLHCLICNSGIEKSINYALNLSKCLSIQPDLAIEKIFKNINVEISDSDLCWMVNKAFTASMDPSHFIANILMIISKNGKKLTLLFIILLNKCVSKALHLNNYELSKYAYIASTLKSLTITFEYLSTESFISNHIAVNNSSESFSLPMLKERLLSLVNNCHELYSLNINYYLKENLKNVMSSGKEINMLGVLSEVNIYKTSFLLDFKNRDNFVDTVLRNLIALKQYNVLLFSAVLKLHSSPCNWLFNFDAQNSDFTDGNKRHTVLSFLSKVGTLFGKSSCINQKLNIFIKCQQINSFFEKCYSEPKLPDMDDITQSKSIILQLFSQNVDLLSLDIIEELCSFSDISHDEGYIFYLFAVLNGSDVEFKVVIDNFGVKHIMLKGDEHDTVKICTQILSKIKNRENLVHSLKSFYKNGEISILDHTFNINQYHYEVYLCVLHLISQITGHKLYTKDYMLLMFLKHYFRTSPPKNSEIDLYKFRGCFPEISYYRLPFQPFLTKDLWKSLKSSEINLMTYQQWLPVVSLLPLNVDSQTAHDMLCSNAVKQSMTTKKNLNVKVAEWSLTLENDLLLNKAYDCVQLISKPEWATACLFYVLQGSKSGADQVAAAALCYQFTESRSKTHTINFTDKMKNKYIIANTMHILYKYDLADKSLLKLCDMPTNLIKELYNHSSLGHEETPSINKAIDEIAETCGLNITALKTEIFEDILEKCDKIKSLDDTVDIENQIRNVFLKSEDLKRACYVFRSSTPLLTALYLSKHSFDVSIQISVSKRLKYLQCLLSLINNEILENVTDMTCDQIWCKIWELYFVNAFQMLDMMDISRTFLENRSKALVHIWNARNFGNMSPILFIIMKMAFVYNLRLSEFINDFLILALKHEYFNELRDFLTLLPSYKCESLTKTYNELIVSPFECVEDAFTVHQKRACMLALKSLYACPVYDKVDLMQIWKKCISAKHPEIASILLPIMPKTNRKKLIKQLGNNFRKFFSNLELISSEYYFPIETVKFVVKECITGE